MKKKLINLIKAGVDLSVAALACEIQRVAFDALVAQGQTHQEANIDSPEHDLWNEIEFALADAEATLAVSYRMKAQENPDVALEILERRWPSRWGK